MAIQSATPYLILGGRGRDAIAWYEKALGATVADLKRFGDVDASCPEARRDLIMHAELRLGSAVVLLSDGPCEDVPPSGNVSVALQVTDPAVTRRAFDALAEGGQVIQPLFDSPWGTLFGVVVDRFGISWMFDSVR
ncbi:MAG: VOC family protein [Acidobacteriota bacterium]|jgi:PhnB protein|nr:MAG: VOC family protein [Acidobacteriota bacterium]